MQRGRFFAGHDADGKPIYKSKHKPLTGATLNRYVASLSAVITWAIHKRIAPKGYANPARAIERKEESDGRVRYLEPDERVALLTACRASKWNRLYLLVLMALVTGARRGELERMKWGDIDFTREESATHLTKNGDSRTLPLRNEALLDELRAHIGAPGTLIFASKRRPDVAFNSVPTWQHALSIAGIKRFRFHDLRHSCASYLAQSGTPLLEIANVLGHRSLAVTKRYSHLNTKNKADLVARVLGGIK
jgi:integrase